MGVASARRSCYTLRSSGVNGRGGKNRYVYFRRTFSLERDAHNAFVFVSADGRYQLFVNGHRVRRGPSRCHPTDLHCALSYAGQYDALLNCVQRWAEMLEANENTFRETWQIDDLTSMCHGWAATPTYDLSAEVLGVKPVVPGFMRCRIAPHPCDLSWARGIVPTPQGAIEVDWRAENDHFGLTVTVPRGTEAEVILPELI
jgi:hypothetical protein